MPCCLDYIHQHTLGFTETQNNKSTQNKTMGVSSPPRWGRILYGVMHACVCHYRDGCSSPIPTFFERNRLVVHERLMYLAVLSTMRALALGFGAETTESRREHIQQHINTLHTKNQRVMDTRRCMNTTYYSTKMQADLSSNKYLEVPY